MQDTPITGVVIVTDPVNCPPGYTLIDRTYDKREDADLWKDSIFSKRVTRYLCLEKSYVVPGKNVLVDVSIINDRDPPPAGFTCLEYTEDTRDKALKKKCLCVRWMTAELTNDGITELILLSKGARRPPADYRLVGDLNNLPLCFKMGSVSTKQQQPATQSQPNAYNMSPMNSALPYSVNPAAQTNASSSWNRPSGTIKRSTLERTSSIIANPLSGIPWQIHHSLTGDSNNDLNLPVIKYKSMMEIENEYEYDFRLEQTAKQRVPPSP